MLDDKAEDQFPLAARVTGIDQADHVFAFDQAGQQAQAVCGLFNRIEREVRGNHRQVGK